MPRKLVCLESSWNDLIFQRLSVQGFFQALVPLIRPPLKTAYRAIESPQHLTFYTRKPDGLLWSDLEAWDAPIFYLAFHGAPGKVFATLEQIDSEMLFEAFKDYGEHKTWAIRLFKLNANYLYLYLYFFGLAQWGFTHFFPFQCPGTQTQPGCGGGP